MYVDDVIVITKTAKEMQKLTETLVARFKIKDMGALHYCLGISIERGEDGKYIRIHQKHYILNMLEKYGLTEAKTVSTLANLSVKLKMDDGVSKSVDPVAYQSMVGSLLYAAIATRPEITQAVGVVKVQLKTIWSIFDGRKTDSTVPEWNCKSGTEVSEVRRWNLDWILGCRLGW